MACRVPRPALTGSALRELVEEPRHSLRYSVASAAAAPQSL